MKERLGDKLTGHEKAKHMARYSHKQWIAWKDRFGAVLAAELTEDNLRIATVDVRANGGEITIYGR